MGKRLTIRVFATFAVILTLVGTLLLSFAFEPTFTSETRQLVGGFGLLGLFGGR